MVPNVDREGTGKGKGKSFLTYNNNYLATTRHIRQCHEDFHGAISALPLGIASRYPQQHDENGFEGQEGEACGKELPTDIFREVFWRRPCACRCGVHNDSFPSVCGKEGER